MKNKIKILYWAKKHHFAKFDKVPRYYFDVEIIYQDRVKFILHNKLILYLFGLLSILSFFILYYNDIKVFSLLISYLDINFNNTEKFNDIIIFKYIYIIDKIIHNKYLIFILVLLIIFIVFFIRFDYKMAYKLIIKIIYRRINYIINLSFFLIMLDLDLIMYFEYNFLYLLIIFCFIIKDILKSIYYRKLCLDSFFCHFLSIPYFLIITSFIILLIQSIYFYPIFYYVLFLNKKFFIISSHNDVNKSI